MPGADEASACPRAIPAKKFRNCFCLPKVLKSCAPGFHRIHMVKEEAGYPRPEQLGHTLFQIPACHCSSNPPLHCRCAARRAGGCRRCDESESRGIPVLRSVPPARRCRYGAGWRLPSPTRHCQLARCAGVPPVAPSHPQVRASVGERGGTVHLARAPCGAARAGLGAAEDLGSTR